jgi:pimeloyl-ACP methyl ester carboxylesterase
MPTAVAQAARVRRLYAPGRFGQMHVRIARPDPNPPGLPKRRPLICFHMSPLSGQMFETWLAEMGRDRIAVQLALQRPKTVRHIVLVGAGMYSQAQQKKHYAAFKQAPVHDDGSHLLNLWRSMMRWRGPHRSLEDLMASYPDMLRGGENQHLIYKANTEFSLVEHLKELYQPILVLNPRDDLWEYTPLIESHLKPSDRLVNLPGCGIGFLDYHTKATSEMVRGFVDG